MIDTFTRSADYTAWLSSLKSRIQSAHLSATRSINSEMILLYWDIGRGIVEKQAELGWGQAVIVRLSHDLCTAFPAVTGFSPRNLRNMKQFYTAYSTPEIWQQAVAKLNEQGSALRFDKKWQQVVAKIGLEGVSEQFLRQVIAEIPWGHHLAILNKIADPTERLYYLRATAQFGWTRNVLINQIEADAYERSLAEGKSHNFPSALPEHLVEQAEEVLKSSYNLEFLGISREVKERELEGQLIGKLQDFILELGYGFCFVGRQYRMVLGSKEYFIDLLFYHRFLKSLVAFELKVGEFKPEYAGKMDFYLNLLNEKERATDDNPSIGIILCAEKDNLEVEFALKSKTNPIGVAEYQVQSTLPGELKGKLPTSEQLSDALDLPIKKERSR